MKRILLLASLLALALTSLQLRAQNAASPTANTPAAPPVTPALARPHYNLRAHIDTKLLTFNGSAQIDVPVTPGDSMSDAVFFIFANAGGVGGDDTRVKNIDVSSVGLANSTFSLQPLKPVPFKLDGAVLRVTLPTAQRSAFTLFIDFRGVVPRAPAGAGGLMEMMGSMDLGSLFGGATGETKAKPKNTDYGLYSYSDGMLSLGSFWYPTLAVRKDGKWIDEAPEGLGDVAFAELSDYHVTITTPTQVGIAATGQGGEGFNNTIPPTGDRIFGYDAYGVRDFSVLLSEDYVYKSKVFDIAGKPVTVEAMTTKAHASKADSAIDIAGHALQSYAKRFGPYRYDSFKVVEGPIKGGAGGMEYSGMTTIATMLYGDLGKELGALADSLGAPGVDAKALDGILGGDDDKAGGGKAEAGKAKADKSAKTTDDAKEANPAADLLGGMLGGQKEVLDSLFEMTIAHEVAHQWWAIGVGSDSQRAPWLDESLTNYSAITYFEDRYGKARAQRMMDAHLKSAYSMARMLGQKDAAVNLRTSAYDGNVQYGAIVYGKGALFYNALRTEIGDAAFFGALRDYYAAENGKLAVPADLMRAFVSRAPAKKAAIAALWKRWIQDDHGDDDITGGPPASLSDMLGGMLGGAEE